jgi:hypothetical protein
MLATRAIVVAIGLDAIAPKRTYCLESNDSWKNKRVVIVGGGTGNTK